MTNEEIRYALRAKCAVVWRGKIYDYIQAWRVSVDAQTKKYISSLEIVERRPQSYVLYIALADEVEIYDLEKEVQDAELQ